MSENSEILTSGYRSNLVGLGFLIDVKSIEFQKMLVLKKFNVRMELQNIKENSRTIQKTRPKTIP